MALTLPLFFSLIYGGNMRSGLAAIHLFSDEDLKEKCANT
jgi:hypothetical protein